MCDGLRVWPIFCAMQNFFWVFEVIQSMWFTEVEKQARVSEKEDAETDQILPTKIEDFCSVLQFQFLAFLISRFSCFPTFGPGWQVMEP